jgi:hypothetical protein
MKTSIMLAGFVGLVSSSVYAQIPQIDEASVQYVGTGCPEGSVDYSITDDGKLDFDFFENNADTDQASVVINKGCVISLRVQAPPGYRIAPSTVTLTGEAIVSAQGRANASAKLTRAGHPEISAGRVFESGFQGSFEVTSNPSSAPFSSCGGSLDLKIRSQLRAERASSDALQTSVSLQDGATNRPFAIRCPLIIKPCP